MKRSLLRLVLPTTAVFAGAFLALPSAAAAPSCIAQSIPAEHAAYGTAWGHDLIAYLATHPEELQAFGFRSFGAFAAYAASLDHEACPADL